MKTWKRILSASMVASVALLGAACADGADDTDTGVIEETEDTGTTGDTGDTGTTGDTDVTGTETETTG